MTGLSKRKLTSSALLGAWTPNATSSGSRLGIEFQCRRSSSLTGIRHRPAAIAASRWFSACAFADFFWSRLPLIASRANRSARSLAVSRRVACSLASYSKDAFTLPVSIETSVWRASSVLLRACFFSGCEEIALQGDFFPKAPRHGDPQIATPFGWLLDRRYIRRFSLGANGWRGRTNRRDMRARRLLPAIQAGALQCSQSSTPGAEPCR